MPKRVDANQKEIVLKLRDLGCSVQILSDLGKGCPDLLCGFKGKNYLFEVKNGDKAKLTMPEQEFFDHWKGQACIIRSLDDVINFFKDISFLDLYEISDLS